ncbi:dipeptidase [Blastopirellula retiformator]|uniref:Membrane dipeptidase (Peptidase family M19) n=1 Tax=Blastopirellula retiformator TaxID=2527970 RepID=A0A5C5UU57_9BACT|nr:dipeptidase [Blastopirellula retiformator]TWT29901.1 Membrane dipeptidase (Peptidase family M19) [Blastopirellula retiformator]
MHDNHISWLAAALVTLAGVSPILAEDSTFQPTPPQSRGDVVLTDEAKKLHEALLMIDGHNDMPWEIRIKGSSDFDKLDISKPQPKLHTDIPRLREGNVGAQFWSVWVPVSTGYDGTALLSTLEQIDLVKAMIKRYPDDMELALTVDDIERISKEGKIASLIGVEGGHCIEDSIGNLERLYDLGARYMTLTHSASLSWADSCTGEKISGGLNPFGVHVVETMNRLGMMVDVSHVSPATAHAALDASKAPVIFSHSSAAAIAASPRNVPDDVLKRMPENGGVVMVNFFSSFIVPESVARYEEGKALEKELTEKHGAEQAAVLLRRWKSKNPQLPGNIHDLLDHIDHIVKVAGWRHVGIGSDYDGVTLVPKGLEDVSRYPYITQGLLDRGYTPEQIKAIMGGNLIRAMREVEATAKKLQAQAAAK